MNLLRPDLYDMLQGFVGIKDRLHCIYLTGAAKRQYRSPLAAMASSRLFSIQKDPTMAPTSELLRNEMIFYE